MKGITEHWFAIGLEQRVVAVDAMCTVGPSNGVGLFVLWVSDSQLIDDAMEIGMPNRKKEASSRCSRWNPAGFHRSKFGASSLGLCWRDGIAQGATLKAVGSLLILQVSRRRGHQ